MDADGLARAELIQQVCQRLLAAREALGESRADWCKKHNLSRNKVSQWETGAHMPDLLSLLKLAERDNLSLDYILLGRKVRVRVPAGSQLATAEPTE